jgi:hypothetical protein
MRRQRREAVLAIQAELDVQQALNRQSRRLAHPNEWVVRLRSGIRRGYAGGRPIGTRPKDGVIPDGGPSKHMIQ